MKTIPKIVCRYILLIKHIPTRQIITNFKKKIRAWGGGGVNNIKEGKGKN
jgi:hypothetical protein